MADIVTTPDRGDPDDETRFFDLPRGAR